MQILVVNGFEDGRARSEVQYRIFIRMLREVFCELKATDCNFIERRINQLGDMTVDWTHESLTSHSIDYCRNFDKLDFVFIAGDMCICPWEPVATQVVTLIHMCKAMKKPLFCSGFGALAAIYTMATKGARYNLVNGPLGGEIEQLPTFPHYYRGSAAHPSGWLDNETGDIYSFSPTRQQSGGYWKPVCNIGIHWIPSAGKPSMNRHEPTRKKYAHEDHLLHFDQIVTPIGVDADCARVRSQHVQHYLLKGLSTQNFVVKCYPDWYIRSDGSLPTEEKLSVLADGTKGTVLLCKDNLVVFSVKFDGGKEGSSSNSCLVLRNFVNRMLDLKVASATGFIEMSLKTYLFGADGSSGGSYDSVRDREYLSPALARRPVMSKLCPVPVDPPALGIFLHMRPPTEKGVDPLALTAGRRTSTIGRRPQSVSRSPISSRFKRLDAVCRSVGETGIAKVVAQSLQIGALENPMELAESLPAALRDAEIGEVMKDENISPRRHNREKHGMVHQSHAVSPFVDEATQALRIATAEAKEAAEEERRRAEEDAVDDGEQFGLLQNATAIEEPFRSQSCDEGAPEQMQTLARKYRGSLRGTRYMMPISSTASKESKTGHLVEGSLDSRLTSLEETSQECLAADIINRVPTFASADNDAVSSICVQGKEEIVPAPEVQSKFNAAPAQDAAELNLTSSYNDVDKINSSSSKKEEDEDDTASSIGSAPAALEGEAMALHDVWNSMNPTAGRRAKLTIAETMADMVSEAYDKHHLYSHFYGSDDDGYMYPFWRDSDPPSSAPAELEATNDVATINSNCDKIETASMTMKPKEPSHLKPSCRADILSHRIVKEAASSEERVEEVKRKDTRLTADDAIRQNFPESITYSHSFVLSNSGGAQTGTGGDDVTKDPLIANANIGGGGLPSELSASLDFHCPSIERGVDLEQSNETLAGDDFHNQFIMKGERTVQKVRITGSESGSVRYARVITDQPKQQSAPPLEDESSSSDEEGYSVRKQLFQQNQRRNNIPHPSRPDQQLDLHQLDNRRDATGVREEVNSSSVRGARKVPAIPDFHTAMKQRDEQSILQSATERVPDQRVLMLQLKARTSPQSARAASPHIASGYENKTGSDVQAELAAINASLNLKRRGATDERRRRNYNIEKTVQAKQTDRRVSTYLPGYARSTQSKGSSVRHAAENIAAAGNVRLDDCALPSNPASNPQSARSARAITTTREQMGMPVMHPTGPMKITTVTSDIKFFWHPSADSESGGVLHSVPAPASIVEATQTKTAATGKGDDLDDMDEFGLRLHPHRAGESVADSAITGRRGGHWDDLDSYAFESQVDHQQFNDGKIAPPSKQRSVGISMKGSYLNEVSQATSYTLGTNQIPIDLREAIELEKPQSVVLIQSPNSNRPYSNYRRIAEQMERQRLAERHGPYQGQYAHPYMHPEQKYLQEKLQEKAKNISSHDFRTHFGPQSTALRPREAGHLQAESEYPSSPGSPLPMPLEAKYWVGFQPNSKHQHVGGTWKL